MSLQVYNIMLLGDRGVGKTSLIHKLFGYYRDDGVYRLTHYIDIYKYTYRDSKQTKKTLMIWDVPGKVSSRFKKSISSNIDAVIIMFSLDSERTFWNARKWHQLITKVNIDIPIILYGNKADIKTYYSFELNLKVDCHRIISIPHSNVKKALITDLESLWNR